MPIAFKYYNHGRYPLAGTFYGLSWTTASFNFCTTISSKAEDTQRNGCLMGLMKLSIDSEILIPLIFGNIWLFSILLISRLNVNTFNSRQYFDQQSELPDLHREYNIIRHYNPSVRVTT